MTTEPCRWCGTVLHKGLCPRVRHISYYENGNVQAVDFFEESPKPKQSKGDLWKAVENLDSLLFGRGE